MSILLINKQEKKITVASDGRSLIGDFVISDNIKKIKKITKKLIVGSVGYLSINTLWNSFVKVNKQKIENISSIQETITCSNNFVDYLKNFCSYDEEDLCEELCGSTLLMCNSNVVNIIKFSNKLTPIVFTVESTYSVGCGSEYAQALIDYGVNFKEIISMVSKRYSNIGNSYFVEEIKI